MSIYKVKEYVSFVEAHHVVEEGDDEDNWIYIDLMLSGEMEDKEPEDLVGERVEIETLKPYLMIAHDIEVL